MESANSYKVRAIVSAIAALFCGLAPLLFSSGHAHPFWCYGAALIFIMLTHSNVKIYDRLKR